MVLYVYGRNIKPKTAPTVGCAVFDIASKIGDIELVQNFQIMDKFGKICFQNGDNGGIYINNKIIYYDQI